MHGHLRKWFLFALLVTLFVVPFSVQAQEQLLFEQVSVQIWPEYDSPDILVILNLQLATDESNRLFE